MKCPVCGREDYTRKVTAIVKEGTSYSEQKISTVAAHSDMDLTPQGVSWGTGRAHGSSTTRLAGLLSFPSHPQRMRIGGCSEWVGWFMIALVLSTPLLCGWTFAFAWVFNNSINGPASTTLDSALPFIVLVLFPLALAPAGWFIYNRSAREKQLKQKDEQRYAQEVEWYNSARECYDRLYYCGRDDVVFDPWIGLHCVPGQLVDYLSHLISIKPPTFEEIIGKVEQKDKLALK